MRVPRAVALALSCAAACLTPAAALAATEPQPLVNVPPLGTTFIDHVGPVSHAALRIAGATPATAYMTPDGLSISVQFSRSYTPAANVAQTYVDFLAGLPHGSELSQLKVFIAPPDEVVDDCGGEDGTLACYDPSNQTMTVPGQQTEENDGSGVTTSYVLAHEYGHHIARHRLNPPFSALDYGPKYWSSFEHVCRGTYDGRLFPGDEGSHYLANPGEAWADTYAHITYPKVFWQFTDLLRPTAASFAAAKQDVLTPWTTPVTKVLRGSFSRGGSDVRSYFFWLHLDGTVRIVLHGPRQSNYDLALSSLHRSDGGTRAVGSDDVYVAKPACRDVDSEHVLVRVLRRSGSGPFTATLSYAG